MKFLVAEADGGANANGSEASNLGSFEVIPRGGKRFAFRSHHNRYLVAEQNGSLKANRNQIEAWEEFGVTCYDG